MTDKNEIYKCNVCGNVVSVLIVGGGTLVCCGEEMRLQNAKTAEEEGREKHVPVVEIDGNIVTVKVGSIPHPMEDAHFIGLVQLMKDGNVIAERKLSPGEKPEASFFVEDPSGVTAREYCNLHGLWTN